MEPSLGNIKTPLMIIVIAAALGFTFSAVSTYDFAQHLDRQVHSIHCSFVPGLGADATGSSGCHTTMMSPYSSVLRQTIWGGLPVSLPAMSVFAWIACLALWMIISKQVNQASASVLAVSTLIPAVTSLIMAFIAFTKLHAACKLCIGIYLCSAVLVFFALNLWGRTKALIVTGETPTPSLWPVAITLLGLAVLIPSIVYAVRMPDHGKFVGTCGDLEASQGLNDMTIHLGGSGSVSATEILDPLCPACRAFEERLQASGLSDQITRRGLMFPLDNTCNWMVDSAVHPGACAISEAVLCAGNDAAMVLAWAFENQDHIREASAANPKAAEKMARERFPSIGSCIGSASVRAKLNRSLRWAVANHLPVLTPQLYVGKKKLCDEDTDLGLDYSLSRLLEKVR